MKREKGHKWLFITFGGLKFTYMLWIIISEIACTDLVNIPEIYGLITLFVSCFNQVWKTSVLVILLLNMRKCTHFEFRRLIFPTTLYFVMDFISYSLCIYLFTVFRWNYYVNNVFEMFALALYLLGIP